MYTETTLKIAKFMGITPIKGIGSKGEVYYYYNDPIMKDYESLPLYDNWDELMPVVIKIERLGGDENEFDIFGNCVQLGDAEFVGKNKIEAVYKAVEYWINNKN